MKYKLSKFRLTIPQEIREHTNISRDGYIDISFDESTGNIIIKNYTDLLDSKEDLKENVTADVKKESTCKKRRKIEANFMDADKLYKAYFSECGLVAKTKTKYVNDFCNECNGQLAREWEDKAEVKCSRLVKKPSCVKCNEDVDIDEIRKKRKEDLKAISESIKIADSVLDVKISELHTQKKRDRKPKKDRGDTMIRPIRFENNTCMKCSMCGQYYKSGFLLDDKFSCSDCAKEDFKEYIRERGNR